MKYVVDIILIIKLPTNPHNLLLIMLLDNCSTVPYVSLKTRFKIEEPLLLDISKRNVMFHKKYIGLIQSILLNVV